MKQTTNPEEGGESLPFFVKPPPYYYRVTYNDSKDKYSTILYYSVPELMLNLRLFRSDDTVTYLTTDDLKDFIKVTVDQFKFTISRSTYAATLDELEQLYLRLLLTNYNSKAISDRGYLRKLDMVLISHLITLKGGIDSYLTYESKKVIHYIKYRRFSINHCRAILIDRNRNHDININHVNLPRSIPGQGLLLLCLKNEIKTKFQIHNYDPLEEDNILTTETSKEILKVINKLIL